MGGPAMAARVTYPIAQPGRNPHSRMFRLDDSRCLTAELSREAEREQEKRDLRTFIMDRVQLISCRTFSVTVRRT